MQQEEGAIESDLCVTVGRLDMIENAIRAAVTACALVFALEAAADYEAGRRAWDAGNPAEALDQWRAAAAAGDRRAMLALGRLYVRGLGAPQDYLEAHKWLNLAASRGEMEALEERDELAAKMTPRQVAAAQERASSWRPGGGRSDGEPDSDAAKEATAAKPDPPTETEAAGPPPPRAIREAQRLLSVLGYKPGPVDGKWGARTGAAYRAFLGDVGLPEATETLTPKALRALRSAAKRSGGGAESGVAADAGSSRSAVPPSSRPAARPDALHRAVKAGDIDGLKAALASGADVNARDGRGWTALMHAANKGHALMVPHLLAVSGADLDVRAADGATALFMAVLQGHGEVVEQLVKGGADISIKGPKTKTPMEIAELRKDEEVLELLEKASRDDKAFDWAKSSSNFENYLTGRPDGRHADEARRLLAEKKRKADDAAFARMESEGTGQAYANYLGWYPEGRHADDAAFARAAWVDTGPAYDAYLALHPQGKHAAVARERATRKGPDIHPICADLPGEYRLDKHAECWEEIASMPGCHYWSRHHHSDRIASSWSGKCSGGIADGSGTLFVPASRDHTYLKATGTFAKGKAHGHWIQRYGNGTESEGSYVDGKEQGDWVWRSADGDAWDGPYVNGNLHGRWVKRGSGGGEWNCWENGKRLDDDDC